MTERPPSTPDAAAVVANIRFLHRGQKREVTPNGPHWSLLEWLRGEAGCTGTKEGCNEGDCGACTVVLGIPDDGAPGGLALRPVNACLTPLPSVHGCALYTVESLADDPACEEAAPVPSPTHAPLHGANAHQRLHPVQQALVDHHGSQCGFCTPGFVMSMWAGRDEAAHRERTPTRQDWQDLLSGNLCRCTGYRPILEAAQQSCAGQPSALHRLPRATIRGQLDALRARTTKASDLAHAERPPTSSPVPGSAHLRPVERWWAPTSAAAFAQAWLELQAGGCDAHIVGGATDIGVWLNKGHQHIHTLLSVQQVPEFQTMQHTPDGLWIGAAVRLEDAWTRLAQHWPSLRRHQLRFASPPIRHAGTLVGNLANGSPIGDGAPALMALDAQLVLRCGQQRRTVPLDAFYRGYRQNALQQGEFIEAVVVPIPQPGAPNAAAAPLSALHVWKIAQRYDSDISAVCGAFRVMHGGPRLAPRLVFGGMGPVVQRARGAEAALEAHGCTREGIAAAQSALADDFKPLTDVRGSAQYRLQAASALLERLWWAVNRPEVNLEVWA